MRGRGLPRRLDRRRQGCRRCERPRELAHIQGIDENAGLVGDELRRAADTRRDDGSPARHPLEDRLTERLDQRRRADDVGRVQPAGHRVVRNAPDDPHTRAPLEARPERPVADEGERAAAEPGERVGEPDDVLAIGERADMDERGRSELRRRLMRAVLELPEIYRAPVVLRDIQGLTTEEASSRLRLKDQTLKSRLHRGRVMLRDKLRAFTTGLSLHRPTPAYS